jgi:hypothetical protein
MNGRVTGPGPNHDITTPQGGDTITVTGVIVSRTRVQGSMPPKSSNTVSHSETFSNLIDQSRGIILSGNIQPNPDNTSYSRSVLQALVSGNTVHDNEPLMIARDLITPAIDSRNNSEQRRILTNIINNPTSVYISNEEGQKGVTSESIKMVAKEMLSELNKSINTANTAARDLIIPAIDSRNNSEQRRILTNIINNPTSVYISDEAGQKGVTSESIKASAVDMLSEVNKKINTATVDLITISIQGKPAAQTAQILTNIINNPGSVKISVTDRRNGITIETLKANATQILTNLNESIAINSSQLIGTLTQGKNKQEEIQILTNIIINPGSVAIPDDDSKKGVTPDTLRNNAAKLLKSISPEEFNQATETVNTALAAIKSKGSNRERLQITELNKIINNPNSSDFLKAAAGLELKSRVYTVTGTNSNNFPITDIVQLDQMATRLKSATQNYFGTTMNTDMKNVNRAMTNLQNVVRENQGNNSEGAELARFDALEKLQEALNTFRTNDTAKFQKTGKHSDKINVVNELFNNINSVTRPPVMKEVTQARTGLREVFGPVDKNNLDSIDSLLSEPLQNKILTYYCIATDNGPQMSLLNNFYRVMSERPPDHEAITDFAQNFLSDKANVMNIVNTQPVDFTSLIREINVEAIKVKKNLQDNIIPIFLSDPAAIENRSENIRNVVNRMIGFSEEETPFVPYRLPERP